MLILQDYEKLKKLFNQAHGFLCEQIKANAKNKTCPIDETFRHIELLNTIIEIETVDRYIEHRIETDKVLIGILKDIQGEYTRTGDMQEQIMNTILQVAKKTLDVELPTGKTVTMDNLKGKIMTRDDREGGAGVVAEIEAPPAASPEPAAAPEQPEPQVPAAPPEPPQTPDPPGTGDGP